MRTENVKQLRVVSVEEPDLVGSMEPVALFHEDGTPFEGSTTAPAAGSSVEIGPWIEVGSGGDAPELSNNADHMNSVFRFRREGHICRLQGQSNSQGLVHAFELPPDFRPALLENSRDTAYFPGYAENGNFLYVSPLLISSGSGEVKAVNDQAAGVYSFYDVTFVTV